MRKSVLPKVLFGACLFMLSLESSVAATVEAYTTSSDSIVDDSIVDVPSAYPVGELSDYPSAGPVVYDNGPSLHPSAYPASADATLIEVIGSQDDLTVLYSLIDLSGLSFYNPPYTVFAPINDGFDALTNKYPFLPYYLEPEYILQLRDILRLHVTIPKYLESDLTSGLELTMGTGDKVTVETIPCGVTLDFITSNTTIVEADLLASDGVVHKVNNVLEPLFLSKDIATVATTDLPFDDYGIFQNLVALVPSVAQTLTGWNYTLLAPNNDAFAKLPNGTLDFLTADENIDTLTSILNYHIITQVLPSPLIVDETVDTVEGSTITITANVDKKEVEGIFFNDAKVILPDVLANNGIIHGIDAVLIPPADDPTAAPTNTDLTDTPVRSPRAKPSRY